MRFGGDFQLLSGICFGLIWLFVCLRAGLYSYAVSRLAFGNSWVCAPGGFSGWIGVVGPGLRVFWLRCAGCLIEVSGVPAGLGRAVWWC